MRKDTNNNREQSTTIMIESPGNQRSRTKSKSPILMGLTFDDRNLRQRHKSASAQLLETTQHRHKSVTPTSNAASPIENSSTFHDFHLRKKWNLAFRIVQSITRFKNMPIKHKFEHLNGANNSNESTPSHSEEPEIDPIYLALKQATGKYGGNGTPSGTNSANGSRRGSSVNYSGIGAAIVNSTNSTTPSPRNLSQNSLQDSGYAEPSNGGTRSCVNNNSQQLIGSTPQLNLYGTNRHNSNGINGHQPSAPFSSALARNGLNGNCATRAPATTSSVSGGRRPKLSEKMKSLSLDCAEMTPSTNIVNNYANQNNSPFKNKQMRCPSGESSDWERSCSPTLQLRGTIPHTIAPVPPTMGSRRLPLTSANGTHVVIHEYAGSTLETTLFLGDRLHIVDNGDPDWLHAFKVNDHLEQLLTFPATCVTAIQGDEQPMKLAQNVHIPECKLRLYRDQVVFAQPDSIRDNRILVRNGRNAFVYCPLQYLILL